MITRRLIENIVLSCAVLQLVRRSIEMDRTQFEGEVKYAAEVHLILMMKKREIIGSDDFERLEQLSADKYKPLVRVIKGSESK